MKVFRRNVLSAIGVLALLLIGQPIVAAPPVKVDSATPSTGEQGTVELDVVVAGSGFEPGARVDFFVTGGETDTGNVVVNSVTYNNSKKLTARVSLTNAKIADFDVKVTLTSGRNGKGITLFKVVAKGGGNQDTTAPGTIGSVTVSPLALALRLTFVAPGDDGFAGTASGYELEYKTFAGDCAVGSWLTAPNIDNAKPANGGVMDSLPVQGLSPGTMYCVRLRARDEALNWSGWTELTASTTPAPWSSELVAGPRFDQSGAALFATKTRTTTDVDGTTRYVAWTSAPPPSDSQTAGRKLTIATGDNGQWTLFDAVQGVVPSQLFVRARPGGGVGVMVLGYVVVDRKAQYRVVLIERTPTAGGYTWTELVLVEGTSVGSFASPLAYSADGTLSFAYQRIVATKRTSTTSVALRRRNPSGVWTEQLLLTPAVQGPELAIAPDGGLAVAASACGRTLYGRQDPMSGAWAFHRTAPTTAYVSGHAIVFETSGAVSIVANSSSSPDQAKSVIRYRDANLEPDPVLTVTASQLPANLDAVCASSPPAVEPPDPETVLSPSSAAPLGNGVYHAGVSADSSGVHVRAVRFWNDLHTLLTVSDCGGGWQEEELVDIGHVGFSSPWGADPVLDAAQDVVAAYSPEPAGVGTFASPASSIRLSKRVGNACSGPP